MSGKLPGFDDHISALVTESGRGRDFLGLVYKRAVAAQAASTKSDGHAGEMSRLSIYLNGRIAKTRDITALDYVDFFERLYGSGHPLEGVKIITSTITSSNMDYVAALYYFQQKGSIEITGISSVELTKLITQVALEQGRCWNKLLPLLALIDSERPGCQLVDGIPDLLKNLDKTFTSDYDVAVLQQSGGVERIKAVGANLEKICKTLFEGFDKAKLGQNNLPLFFAFLKDANDDLLASGAITQADVGDRNAKLILGVLRAWQRVKGEAPDYYRSTIVELTPYLDKKLGSEVIPRLAKVVPVAEISQMYADVRVFIEPSLFKTSLKKYTNAEHRYDLVMGLGLEDLFTQQELNKLKGEKLESALGL